MNWVNKEEINIHSLEELENFAQLFSFSLNSNGAVVLLSGELGAGKTTFVRAFMKALYDQKKIPLEKVVSPTFVIHQNYPFIEHFDLYRLENAGTTELMEVGYFEALDRSQEENKYLFVEWPEKVKNPEVLKADHWLRFSIDETKRVIAWNCRSK